jgi:hypothetical protein
VSNDESNDKANDEANDCVDGHPDVAAAAVARLRRRGAAGVLPRGLPRQQLTCSTDSGKKVKVYFIRDTYVHKK